MNTSNDNGPLEQCVSTDATGRFALAAELAETRGVVASAKGYRSRLQVLDPAAAPGRDIVIVLEPGGEELAGQVMDATGGPVVGAVVTLRANSDAIIGATLSGSDGKFAMDASPGVVELCAQAESYSRDCREAAVPSDGHVLMLAPESTIVGKVMTEATGKPVVGATVSATNLNGLQVAARATSSGDDGTFVIDGLPAGGYDVVAVSSDSRSTQQWVAVGVGETAPSITLWAAPATRVSGVVLISGDPCPRGNVELSGPIWVRERVLADGTVRIDGVVPGRYDTTAYCGDAPSHTASLDIENQPVEHTWALERLPGSLDPGDAPAPNAASGGTIMATIEGQPGEVVAVFAESRDGVPFAGKRRGTAFVFEGLLPGEYRVYVNDYFEQAQRARLTRDGELVEVRLKSAAPGWIVGRVTSDDGVAVQDAWVSYYRTDSMTSGTTAAPPTLTDEDGTFNLAGVPGVPYTVTVASPSGDARVDGVKANEAMTIRVSAPASLSGWVQTANGESVPEFTLTYRAAHDTQLHERRGVHSAFHVSMLQPGSYSLQVTSPLGSASREVQLAPREDFTLTMTLTGSESVSTD